MVVPPVIVPLLRPSRPASHSASASASLSSSISPANTSPIVPVLCTGCRHVWKKVRGERNHNNNIGVGFIEWHVGKFSTRNISWILCVRSPVDLIGLDTSNIVNVKAVVIDNGDVNVQVHVRREILRLHNGNSNININTDEDGHINNDNYNPAIIILKDAVLARKTLASNNSTWKNQYDIHSKDDIVLTRGFDSAQKINAMLVAMNLSTNTHIHADSRIATEKKKKNNPTNNNCTTTTKKHADALKSQLRDQESQWRLQVAANSHADSTPTEQVKEASVEKQKKNSFFLNMLG